MPPRVAPHLVPALDSGSGDLEGRRHPKVPHWEREKKGWPSFQTLKTVRFFLELGTPQHHIWMWPETFLMFLTVWIQDGITWEPRSHTLYPGGLENLKIPGSPLP